MEKLRKLTLVGLFLFPLVLLRAVPVWGQDIAVAQITGVITDATGAAVPNAHVTATQTNTGLVRATITGPDGIYVLPDLPIGPYKLEVGAPAFKTYLQSGIVLQVGNKVEINVNLQLGSLTQQVEVTANANLINVQESAVSTVVDQQRMVDLPLNGRNATQLVLLAGATEGVTSGISGQFDLSSSGGVGKSWPTEIPMAVAGGQANGTNWILDGSDHNDAFNNTNLPFPFPDALEEFSVETSSRDARTGEHPGAVVNMVTKSGTNGIHGDAFEFLRNGDLNARNFFAASQDTLKRNQFGGTLGGPIIKDKLFFFGGYQGTRQRTAPPTSIFYVPTAASLSGDFSTLESAACQSNGKTRTIIDPATGSPFPNDFVSPSLFNPVALNILKYVPVSSNACGETLVGKPSTGDEDQIIGRIDWTISGKQSLFGRYFFDPWNNPVAWNGTDILPAQRTGLVDRSQSFGLGYNYALSPTIMNSLHLTGDRLRILRGAPPNYIGDAGVGIDMWAYSPINLGVTVGQGHFGTGGPGPDLNLIVNTFQATDDVDIIRGRHHISFGFEFVHNQLNMINTYQGNGNFTFDGSITGDALVDFMLGDLAKVSQTMPDRELWRQSVLGAYASDVFRISSHLTLKAGVRWEPFLPIRSSYGAGNYFDPAAFAAGTITNRFVNAPAGLLYNSDPGIPSNYTNAHRDSFGPRLGLAWDPKGNGLQTLRASYALMYNTPMVFYNDFTTTSPPWNLQVTNFDPPGGLSTPWEGYPGGQPFPYPLPPTKDSPFPQGAEYMTWPLHVHQTYMQQWNLSYERQFRSNWLFSATYLGNETSHLWLSKELNQAVFIPGNCVAGQYGLTAPGPCSTVANTQQRRLLTLENPVWGPYYGNLDTPDDGSNDSYNALLLAVQHRFSNHFTLLSNYTYSHCLGDGDDQGELETSQFQNSNDRSADRGNCASDRRQNFNLSLVATSPTSGGRWLQRLAGNWQLSPIISAASGQWFTVYTGLDNSLTGNDLDRPNVVLPNSVYPAAKGVTDWINPLAFAPNTLGTFGNSGRNSLLGPRSVEFDSSLSRFFPLGHSEVRRLEVRFEAFNLINHANFSVPDNTYTDSTFGQIRSAADPRILEFALKLYF